MKIIQVNKRQISEVVGADFDYLDNGDFKEFNGHSEVSSTGKIDNADGGKDGDPVTSDEYAHLLAPRYWYGTRPVYGTGRIQEDILNDANVPDLSTEDEGTVGISASIKGKIDSLLDIVHSSNTNSKKNAIIIKYILSNMSLGGIPNAWKVELRNLMMNS